MDSATEKRLSAGQNFFELLHSNLHILQNIWNKMGLSEYERKARFQNTVKQINDLLSDIIAEEQVVEEHYYRQRLMQLREEEERRKILYNDLTKNLQIFFLDCFQIKSKLEQAVCLWNDQHPGELLSYDGMCFLRKINNIEMEYAQQKEKEKVEKKKARNRCLEEEAKCVSKIVRTSSLRQKVSSGKMNF
ncbi:hypothetical protein D917_04795 [Trichinella nativa]|uniref:Protein regulator of cytokinesis 1 n=1 Tax=Trichinella nativa TaxID=6335 RepID=A0A1Y3EY43_9BILA|nr:hypothetical protein D917_04795 [Trichinella nativa]